MKKINNFGDTIIEVLIAIAVLSVVLGGAYAISSRSLAGVRKAQEHTEALKYAEQQTERLKKLADYGGNDGSGGNIFTMAAGSCVHNVSGVLKVSVAGTCDKDIGAYKYSIGVSQPTPVTGSPNSFYFNIIVTWPGVGGGTDRVSLDYRLDR